MHPEMNEPNDGVPMGVSQWEAHGKRFGYWDYFTNQFHKDMGTFRQVSNELAKLASKDLSGLSELRELGEGILASKEAEAEQRAIQRVIGALEAFRDKCYKMREQEGENPEVTEFLLGSQNNMIRVVELLLSNQSKNVARNR